MSKNKHPDLGEIQRSLNQALEGYDCQCRMHYDGTVSINVAAREHDETFTFVGIQPGELDNPTRLHLVRRKPASRPGTTGALVGKARSLE